MSIVVGESAGATGKPVSSVGADVIEICDTGARVNTGSPVVTGDAVIGTMPGSQKEIWTNRS